MASQEFNQDELVAPDWLNKNFFKNVLASKSEGKTLNVRNIILTPGSGKGDHYASVMFRAVVEYTENETEKTKSLIVKTMPAVEGHKKDLLGTSTLFQTEIEMYSEVLPKFEKLLRAVGDKTVLAANCLYHSLSPNQVIIFEDLVPLGYEVIRGRQLDMIEAKLTYKKLATLHATSFYINSETPKSLDRFCNGIWALDGFIKSNVVTDGIDLFIDTLESNPTLRQYKQYFIALKPTLLEKCEKTYTEYRINKKPNGIYALCHGDFHCKNLLIKSNKSSNENKDVMLVDYQISFMGPVAIDLIYSYFMLISPELRKNHFDELIYYYFINFLDTLKTLGYRGELPKLIDLRKQLLDHSHLDIFLLVTFLPMWYALSDGIDAAEVMTSADVRQKNYTNVAFLNELEYLLPRFLNLGYI